MRKISLVCYNHAVTLFDVDGKYISYALVLKLDQAAIANLSEFSEVFGTEEQCSVVCVQYGCELRRNIYHAIIVKQEDYGAK